MSSGKQITRVTLFKIPDPANQEKLANIYKEMPTKAKKDGKPYIVSVKAGPTIEDQRNQGYTLAAVSTFASLEDMKYYDTGCEAHDALKVEARQMHQGILVVFYESSA